jgi:hypothetical protein
MRHVRGWLVAKGKHRMNRFRKALAAEAVATLTPGNRAVADHWLSLWNDDRLPERRAFSPAALKPYLPRIAIFDVRPQESVTVRLAGTLYTAILGRELTNCDWIAMAQPHYRAERLRIFSEIAAGAMARGTRRLDLTFGETQVVEEVLLPFAPGPGSGSCPVLCHVDLHPGNPASTSRNPDAATGEPLSNQLFPLRAA